jgi:hypothetical protein
MALLLPESLPLKPPWSPQRPWRVSSCAALTRCVAREWREELPLLRRRWRLVAACAAMQYLHAIAGQARTRAARPCAARCLCAAARSEATTARANEAREMRTTAHRDSDTAAATPRF